MLDEDNLIETAKTGDKDALNELIKQYWQPVFRFASSKTSSPEDAQEITQETFIRVFRSLSNYQKTEAKFKAYLNQIALNLITDLWRKKQRSPAVVSLADYQQPISIDDQPDSQAISHERRDIIAMALRELPDDQRQTVEYRLIVGLPVSETALALGKSEAAIKMLQQRGLKKMRALLLDRGVLENYAER